MAAERPTGLLVDWGGVLTTDLLAGFASFCAREGLEPHALATAFRKDPVARQALVDFECGRLPAVEFEPIVAASLGLGSPDGLIERLFADLAADDAMLDAVAALRRSGIRTGLLSNSWGVDLYDRSRFDELFDVLVISGEEGIRKPDPAIYALAIERLALPAEQIVFIDDFPHNLEPLGDLGMTGIHHTGPDSTIPQLEALFGVALR